MVPDGRSQIDCSVPAPKVADSFPKVAIALCLALAVSLVHPVPAPAQNFGPGQRLGLQALLTDFVQEGIILAPPASGRSHAAHFTARESPQFQALSRVNDEIGRQVSSIPLSSSAGGFAFEFDQALGSFTRPTRSFGPIHAERPLTVGQGKFNLGVNFSFYTFDTLDDLDLRDGDIRLVFTHEDTNDDGTNQSLWFEGDVITADLSLSIRSSITSLVATYGVTDGLDLGLAVPIVSVDMQATSTANVLRLSTGDESDVHVFPNGTNRQVFARTGTASGLGDVVLRAKYRLPMPGRLLAGLSTDLRVPTGDEDNLLGTGALQGKAAILASFNHPTLSPHASVAYTATGEGLPDEVGYAAGLDFAADPKLTLVFDLLGRWSDQMAEIHLMDETYTYNTQPSGTPDLRQARFSRLDYLPDQSVNAVSGAAGLKINLYGNLIVNMSGLFPITKVGLRDNFSPYIGLDYSF